MTYSSLLILYLAIEVILAGAILIHEFFIKKIE